MKGSAEHCNDREERMEDAGIAMKMEESLEQTETSFHVLFETMNADGSARELCGGSGTLFLQTLQVLLRKLRRELADTGSTFPGTRLTTALSEEPDSVDAWNKLTALCGEKTFRQWVDDTLFDALMRLNYSMRFSPELLRHVSDPETAAGSSMLHAVAFVKSLDSVIQNYLALVQDSGAPELTRLNPLVKKISLSGSFFLRSTLKGLALELDSRFIRSDVFSQGRTYRYSRGEFLPVVLKTVRGIQEFYGYKEAKRVLSEHIGAFDAGKYNLPLLISGLPGLGKTQMTIAYILNHPDLTLILPGLDALQDGLEELIAKLTVYKNKKFVLFFDDVDTRTVNWYYFRTYIGGSFTLPPNQMVILASNYRFPPNISSRGRVFHFPLFDEIRCQEMIEDLFLSRGMSRVAPELLSVIAADYVEAFGQKEFEELSPRTLARYLELYLDDPARRRKMLEFSRGEVITKPDSQIFYEMNLKLMKALYGEEAIDDVRKKELGG